MTDEYDEIPEADVPVPATADGASADTAEALAPDAMEEPREVEAPTGLASASPPAVPTPAPAHFPVMLGVTIALACLLAATMVGGVAGVAASRWFADSTSPATTASPTYTSTEEPVADAAAIALPSVVNIDVTGSGASTGLPNGHPDVPTGGTGSGVAYKTTSDGGTYILTNNHVVADAKSIIVTPADGERYQGTLVGRDPETDIAVVRISKKLPLIGIGDSEKLAVGQMVVAIGSPFGLQHSVSSGVVSALHRSITSNYSDNATGSAYPLVDVIQTDAAINPGNSGGALVDRSGHLIGIDSAIYTESGSSAGVGFAIPAKTALRIADELISGLPSATQFENVARSARLSQSGLSMNTGMPASMNGRARSTCSNPLSVATSTASTCPITSSARSAILGISATLATDTASAGSSVHTCVTLAPGMPSVAGGCLTM